MNLIILYPEDYMDASQVRLVDYRQKYVLHIHRPAIGDQLKVGNLNGMLGIGVVTALTEDILELQVECLEPPPTALGVELILALPRPKVFQRVLLTATTLGIKKIIIMNSWRVDKSYWGSPALTSVQVKEQLISGLEQAGDTMLPQVELRPRFKPFVEDELAHIVRRKNAYVAHPTASQLCPYGLCRAGELQHSTGVVIVVGPEGGFIPYEVEKLVEAGCQPINLGARILRVEAAITWLLGHC